MAIVHDESAPHSAANMSARNLWSTANHFLKRNHPHLHGFCKRVAGPWLRGEFGIPLPRRIAGRLLWTQPRLVLTDPPEPHILRWIQKWLSPGDTFFDVGAYAGWMSLVAAHSVGPSGLVMAFEPAGALVEILHYHKRVNRLSQMEIVPCAVSDSDQSSETFFLVNNGLSCRNSLTIGSRDTPLLLGIEMTACEVRCLTLDQFVLDSKRIPTLIKIDVEGAELLVLRGSELTLAAHHPKLIVGVHSYLMPAGHSEGQIFDLLGRYGYWVAEEQKVEFPGGYIADYLCVA